MTIIITGIGGRVAQVMEWVLVHGDFNAVVGIGRICATTGERQGRGKRFLN